MIQKNLFNPIPIHTSDSEWYQNRKTHHGVCRTPIAPIGKILPMQLTFGKDDFVSSDLQGTLNVSVKDIYGMSDFVSTGAYEITSSKSFKIIAGDGTIQKKLTCTFDERENGKFDIKINFNDDGVFYTIYVNNYNKESQDGFYDCTYTGDPSHTQCSVKVSGFSHRFISGKSLELSVRDYYTDVDEYSATADLVCEIAPDGIRSNVRYCGVCVPETTISQAVQGKYYLAFSVGDNSYISEPFLWKNVDDMIMVRYKNASAISDKNNYLPFQSDMKMYIDSEIMMPEFQFDSEVTDTDGFQFARKQVSYKRNKFTFLCTEYMADAVRVLWHCSDVKITQRGTQYKSDYMEPPTVDWSSDNHLCEVGIVFQTDTVVQTTGGVAVIENASEFDFSFDSSFQN